MTEQILENEQLVNYIINKFSNFYQGDREDLYQEGMKGLIKASKNYKKNKNTKFSTYAYTYILGEITTFIRENNNLVLSKDIIRIKRNIEKGKDILRQKLGREPTTLELSLILEIEEDKIEKIEQLNQNTKSLDYVFEEEQDNNLYNNLGVEDKNTNSDILDLKTELQKLNVEEKRIIIGRYYEDKTQTEMSKELGISQVQVYRKEAKVLKKLREKL